MKAKLLVAALLMFLVILAGCQKNKPIPAKLEIPKEVGKGYNAHFCKTENCEKIIGHYLNKGQGSIHCAFYLIDLESVLDILGNKSKAMDVRLVIDESGKNKVKGAKIAKSYGSMHNKFCIIDDEIVITGSFNPKESELQNDNNIFVIYSGLLAKNYEEEFTELWSGAYGSGGKIKTPAINYSSIIIENYFCPEDGCEQKVSSYLKDAERSIHFLAFSFTSEKIADAMLLNKNAEIKGVVEARSSEGEYSQYLRLRDFGINVLKDKNKKTMHHKVFIIDGNIVITGSFNPTESADKRNDENILIIHDSIIAGKYLKEFDRVWELASN